VAALQCVYVLGVQAPRFFTDVSNSASSSSRLMRLESILAMIAVIPKNSVNPMSIMSATLDNTPTPPPRLLERSV